VAIVAENYGSVSLLQACANKNNLGKLEKSRGYKFVMKSNLMVFGQNWKIPGIV
jgi:hypothetical protein